MFEYRISPKWRKFAGTRHHNKNGMLRRMLNNIHKMCMSKNNTDNEGALKSFLIDGKYYVNYNKNICTIADARYRNTSLALVKLDNQPAVILTHPKCSLMNGYGNLTIARFNSWYNDISAAINGDWKFTGYINFHLENNGMEVHYVQNKEETDENLEVQSNSSGGLEQTAIA